MPDSVTLIRQMQHAKKKPVLAYELFLEYGGEGGIDSLRSPFGQPVRCALSLSNWLRRYSAHPWASPLRGQRMRCSKLLPAILCRPPVGASHPPAGVQHAKKSPYLRTSSFSNMAVRGGFEPPIRCRIHTFQACSFSHSDTSPYCIAA